MADVLGRAVLEIAGDSTTYFGESAKVKADAAAIGLAFAELPKALAPLPAALTGSADAAAKLAANFNGDRVIQQAHDIVTAVGQVQGGLQNLGSSQVTQSLSTLDAAMEKIAQRGNAIPPAMQQAAASLRQLKDQQDQSAKSLQDLATREQQAAASASDLAKMVSGFRGDTVIQEAHNITAALAQLGGNFDTLSGPQVKQSLATLEAAMRSLRARGEEVPPAMQQTADSLRRVAEASSEANGPLSKLGGDLVQHAVAWAAGLLSVQAFEAGFRSLVGFVSSSLVEWQKQESAYQKLGVALTNAGLAAPSVRQQMIQLGESFAKTTIYSDDMLQEMEALLVQVGHVMPDQMHGALQAATDLAAGLGIDLQTATMLVGKAFAGETGTLSRYGIVLDQAKVSAEGASYVIDQLHQKFGGQAAAAVDTLAGRTAMAGKAWDEFKEAIGQATAPVVAAGVQGMTTAVEALGSAIHSTMGPDSLAQIIAMRQALGLSTGVTKELGDSSIKTGAQMELERVQFNLVREAMDKHVQGAQASAQWQAILAGQTLDLSAAFADKMTPAARAALVATQALTGAHAALSPALRESVTQMLAGGLAAGEIFDKLKAAKLATDEDRGAIDRFSSAYKDSQDWVKKHAAEMEKWQSLVSNMAAETLPQFIGKLNAATLSMPAHLIAIDAARQAHKGLSDEVYQAVLAMAALPLSTEEITKRLIAGRAATEDDSVAIKELTDFVRGLTKEMSALIEPTTRILSVLPQYKLHLDAGTVATMNVTNATRLLNPEILKGVDAMVRSGLTLDQAIAKLLEYGTINKDDADAVRAHYKEVDTLSQSLSQVSGILADLSRIGGTTFGTIVKGIQEVIGVVGTLSKSLGRAGDVAGGGASGSGGLTGAIGGLFGGAAGTASAVAAAATIVGIGVALIGVAEALASAHNQAALVDNELNRASAASKDFGVSISQSTGQQILASEQLLTNYALEQGDLKLLAQLMGGMSNATTRAAAEALNLSAILKEAGGISRDNLSLVESRLSTLFELAKTDGPLAHQAISQLNDVLKQMGDYFAANGGIWDAAFQKMIAGAKQLGIDVSSIISGQQDKLVSGLAGVTAASGGQATAMLALKQAVVDAQKAYDDLVTSGADQDQIAAAADKLTQAQTAVTAAAVTTQDEFDRLSRESLNAFNTMVASGKSPVEAMQALGGSIDDLINDAKAFGLSGNAAFDELSRWRDLTKNNAPLLTQIGSLNDLMTATANLGGLNAQSFADFQAQGVSAYNGLIAAGFTQQEAEEAEKPLLESIIKLHNDKGLAIDENTQKLIDQATQDGVLSDQQETDQQVLKDGLGAIIKLLGGDIPDAWQKATDASKTAADKIKGTGKDGLAGVADSVSGDDGLSGDLLDNQADWKTWQEYAEARTKDLATAINNMPTTHTVTIDWAVGAPPDLPPGTPTPTRANLPVIPMAEGWAGRVLGPTMFLAGEAGAEDVAFSGAGKAFTGASDDKTVTIVSNLYVDGKKMTQHVQRRNWRDLRKRGY